MNHQHAFNFVGLGSEVGQSHPGLEVSPAYARKLLRERGWDFENFGRVSMPIDQNTIKVRSEDDWARFPLEAYRQSALQVEKALRTGFTLNWGGDHSVGISTVAAFRKLHPDGKVIWFDAHADMNLPEMSPTGHVHGMPLSLLLNLYGSGEKHAPWISNFLSADDIAYVGVRDLDPFEAQTISELGIQIFSSRDIADLGAVEVVARLKRWAAEKPAHLSFDIDAVDPRIAGATGVPVADGVTYGQLMALMSGIGKFPGLKSLDIVEINPYLGSAQIVRETYSVALDAFESVIAGQQISSFENVYEA